MGGNLPDNVAMGVSGFVEGRTSFFFFPEAGRISSRLTGMPRETRKRRRIRDRFQSGGLRGTGAASWFHKDIALSLLSGSMGVSVEEDSVGMVDGLACCRNSNISCCSSSSDLSLKSNCFF